MDESLACGFNLWCVVRLSITSVNHMHDIYSAIGSLLSHNIQHTVIPVLLAISVAGMMVVLVVLVYFVFISKSDYRTVDGFHEPRRPSSMNDTTCWQK